MLLFNIDKCYGMLNPFRNNSSSFLPSFLKYTACWLAFVLIYVGISLQRNFGDITFEQIIFHMCSETSGLLKADKVYIYRLLLNLIIYPLLSVGLLRLLIYFYRKIAKRLFLKTGCNTSGNLKRKNNWGGYFIILFLFLSILFFLSRVSFFTYLHSRVFNKEGGDIFFSLYKEPNDVIFPEHNSKRNLVLIYVESLEFSYSDKSRFKKDLLYKLNKSTDSAYSFDDFESAYGTGWTIAGIVATQCGIPIKDVSVFDGNKIGEKVNYFLPGAVCLGDILQENGYKNVFVGGASLAFSGKGKFLKSHGYTEVYGKEEWEQFGYSDKDFNDWGLYDDFLLNEARKKLDELYSIGQPFNLTVLTLDTHFPKGFISSACKIKGTHNFEELIECETGLVADFINYVRMKGYDKNTDIIVTGDHLSMPNPVFDKLESAPRKIYNKFLTRQLLHQNRKGFVHFDMFPSILHMLGFDFKDGKLGLGVSGFKNTKYRAISFFYDKNRDEKLLSPSKRYLQFWEKNKKTVPD